MDLYLPPSSFRLARPMHWKAARPGMSWHHVIPYSLLREVWRRLVDQHVATEWLEARMAIRQFLMLADRNLDNLDSKLERMRAGDGRRRASHNQLLPLQNFELDALRTAATWPFWNVVEGPNQRGDDPGDSYFERFSFGLTPTLQMQMQCADMLYGEMQAFVSSGATPDAGSLRRFWKANQMGRRMVVGDEPIYYRPEMWVQGGDGKWRKRREDS